MEKIFEGKNCVITGASGGLGEQIALKFAEKKCNIFLTSRNKKQLEKLRKNIIMKNNVKVFVESGDLRKPNDLKKIVSKVREKFMRVDILINCAGIFQIKSISKSTLDDFDDCFNVNIRAPFFFSKEFSKDMIKNKWGRIVNIGSSSSYEGFADTSVYSASKHALLGLSRSLHKELASKKVRVFCVSPGSIKTKMGRKVKNQNYDTFIEPTEIANMIIHLIEFDKQMISEEVRINRTST